MCFCEKKTVLHRKFCFVFTMVQYLRCNAVKFAAKAQRIKAKLKTGDDHIVKNLTFERSQM
jgi:hypothetical protein